MSAFASNALVHQAGDEVLSTEVLVHLEAQLTSARRLLQVVLEQGAAIRARAVHDVVGYTGMLQAELERRGSIERERTHLLERAGVRLGIDPGAVTLTMLARLMQPGAAELAVSRSAELRGLLAQVEREHHVNRVLMSQELTFLDHLLRLADADRELGYDAAGDVSRPGTQGLANRHRVLDLEV